MSEEKINSVPAGAGPLEPVQPSPIELLRRAAFDCAEWIEGFLDSDVFEGGCDWPNVDGTWCSEFCQSHGCAKSRSHHCRAALSKTEA